MFFNDGLQIETNYDNIFKTNIPMTIRLVSKYKNRHDSYVWQPYKRARLLRGFIRESISKGTHLVVRTDTVVGINGE